MRLVTHTKLVQRNLIIGKYAFMAGMALLLAALAVNIYAISQPNNPQLVIYAFSTFLVGITATNIGTAFNNRWGHRSDKSLADALKGVDDKFTLYNYRLGASHVLVGPGGVLVLTPKYQTGVIAFENGKWVSPTAPRGFLGSLFARDPLGNPSAEAAAEVESLMAFLKKHAPELTLTPQPLIVFMSPRAEVSAKDSPVLAIHTKQLKDYLRRLPKGPTIPAAALSELETKLGLAPAE
jgi:hypothetical protein